MFALGSVRRTGVLFLEKFTLEARASGNVHILLLICSAMFAVLDMDAV